VEVISSIINRGLNKGKKPDRAQRQGIEKRHGGGRGIPKDQTPGPWLEEDIPQHLIRESLNRGEDQARQRENPQGQLPGKPLGMQDSPQGDSSNKMDTRQGQTRGQGRARENRGTPKGIQLGWNPLNRS